MYHQRKDWTVNRDLFQEVIDIVFSKMFQKRCRITSWDNYLIHGKWKNSKNQHIYHSFVYRCITKLNQKGLWLILRYILKFNNKLIFDYQNIHLLYGSIWKNLDLKEHRNGYKIIIGRLWSTNCGTRTEWEASRKSTEYFLLCLFKVLIKERMQGTE